MPCWPPAQCFQCRVKGRVLRELSELGASPPASPRLRLDIFRLHSPTGIFLVGRNGVASGLPGPAAAVSCPSPLKSGPWASLPLSQTPGHMAARAAYHRPCPTMLQAGAGKGPLDPKGVPGGGSMGVIQAAPPSHSGPSPLSMCTPPQPSRCCPPKTLVGLSPPTKLLPSPDTVEPFGLELPAPGVL